MPPRNDRHPLLKSSCAALIYSMLVHFKCIYGKPAKWREGWS